MQETELYEAILSELTPIELATVVGTEITRRGLIGILYFYPPGSTEPGYCASSLSDDIKRYAPGPAQQLRLFAAHASLNADEDSWAV